MQLRPLLIFIGLSLSAAAIVIGAVTIYQRSRVQDSPHAPAIKIEANKPNDGTSVDAPYAHIESDKEGTRVEAPGVKIEVPKSPSD